LDDAGFYLACVRSGSACAPEEIGPPEIVFWIDDKTQVHLRARKFLAFFCEGMYFERT
jgi:hypothetical protein